MTLDTTHWAKLEETWWMLKTEELGLKIEYWGAIEFFKRMSTYPFISPWPGNEQSYKERLPRKRERHKNFRVQTIWVQLKFSVCWLTSYSITGISGLDDKSSWRLFPRAVIFKSKLAGHGPFSFKDWPHLCTIQVVILTGNRTLIVSNVVVCGRHAYKPRDITLEIRAETD